MDISKIIIAAYPGLGRHETVELLRQMATSVETKKYKYLNDEIHPEYPSNVVSLINALAFETTDIADYKDLAYIFIDIDKDVFQGLIDREIPFILVLPQSLGRQECLRKSIRRELLEQVDKVIDEFMPKINIVLWMDDLAENCNKVSFYFETIDNIRQDPKVWPKLIDNWNSGI
jgi:hypothetical protein